MDVRLATLGTPGAFLGGKPLSALPGRPISFGLLVYLGVEGEVTRDRLVGLFWPESSQERARHTLSQTLYELRQELGEGWIESSGNMVRTTESLKVDVREFEVLASQDLREEALELYQGHFLDGVHLAQTHAFEDWVGGVRARLSRRHRVVADAFIRDARNRGDTEKALKAAWKWVEIDPLDDGAQHHLIQLLAETGSRTEALTQFERYRTLLQSELSLEPLEDTVALVEAIRERTLPPLPPVRDDARDPPTFHRTPVPKDSGRGGWPPPAPGTGPSPPLDTGEPHVPDTDRPHASDSGEPPAPDTGKPSALHTSKPPAPRDAHSSEATLRHRLEKELSPTHQLLRPIGRGSMSRVFLAREPHLKRLVAVKALSPDLYNDAAARQRFQREAQSAARINHPNVCTVYTVGSLEDGTPYFVSPFIKGTTLTQRLKAEGRLGTEEVRQVVREVASALAAAHKLGIIHRDVRPDNVLREEDTGRHYLSDFGIAGVLETGDEEEPKITSTGEVLGNPAYISPEQVQGRPLTDRADVYSLGIMAHQLLTGHPPPPSKSPAGDRESNIIPPNLAPLREYIGTSDPDLADLITRCLAMDPASRPAAADISRKCEDRARELELRGAMPDTVPESAGNFLSLLMERRFLQIIGAYIAGGWLFIEATDQLEDRGYLPEPAYDLALNTALFGFLAANILAWYHGRKGRQGMTRMEKALLALVAVGWVVGCVLVL